MRRDWRVRFADDWRYKRTLMLAKFNRPFAVYVTAKLELASWRAGKFGS